LGIMYVLVYLFQLFGFWESWIWYKDCVCF